MIICEYGMGILQQAKTFIKAIYSLKNHILKIAFLQS